jgi:hypothetical protein
MQALNDSRPSEGHLIISCTTIQRIPQDQDASGGPSAQSSLTYTTPTSPTGGVERDEAVEIARGESKTGTTAEHRLGRLAGDLRPRLGGEVELQALQQERFKLASLDFGLDTLS